MKFRKKHRQESEVFTDSLVDIIFILLMFFLITSTLANPNVRQAALPKAKTNTKSKQVVVVTIDETGKFYVAAKLVDSAQLYEALLPYIQKLPRGADSTIAINADKRSNIDHFATVLRVADRLRVRTVMAVDKKGVE